MKKKPIHYFHEGSYNNEEKDTFWESAMIRLSAKAIHLNYKYDVIFKKNIPFEYKHFLILKDIGNLPPYV